MGMADRDRQGIGRIGAVDNAARKQMADHGVDLSFIRMPHAHHGFLDLVGRIFGDGKPVIGGRQQHDAARLSQLERRVGVFIHESRLGGRAVGRPVRNDRIKSGIELLQPLRQRVGRSRSYGAVRQMLQPVARDLDNAPSGVAQPRVEPDNSTRIFQRSILCNCGSQA